MKETNMEHFRGEIEAVLESSDEPPCLIDGKLQECKGNMDCHKCEFSGRGDCGLSFVKWAMSEYKEDPVLTAREKHFVEFAQEGWLARDDDGELWWYKLKPEKEKERWSIGSVTYSFKGILDFEQHFRFITWEDEEPWSVEDLRKLKVGGQDA